VFVCRYHRKERAALYLRRDFGGPHSQRKRAEQRHDASL
jgi:hypothetical protein